MVNLELVTVGTTGRTTEVPAISWSKGGGGFCAFLFLLLFTLTWFQLRLSLWDEREGRYLDGHITQAWDG